MRLFCGIVLALCLLLFFGLYFSSRHDEGQVPAGNERANAENESGGSQPAIVEWAPWETRLERLKVGDTRKDVEKALGAMIRDSGKMHLGGSGDYDCFYTLSDGTAVIARFDLFDRLLSLPVASRDAGQQDDAVATGRQDVLDKIRVGDDYRAVDRLLEGRIEAVQIVPIGRSGYCRRIYTLKDGSVVITQFDLFGRFVSAPGAGELVDLDDIIEGLLARISTGEKAYPPGADPEITITLRRVGGDPMEWVLRRDDAKHDFPVLRSFSFEQKHPQGVGSAMDSSIMKWPRPRGCEWPLRYMTIREGEPRRATFKLSELVWNWDFKKLQPGEYSVSADFTIIPVSPDAAKKILPRRVSTNECTFIVREDTDDGKDE